MCANLNALKHRRGNMADMNGHLKIFKEDRISLYRVSRFLSVHFIGVKNQVA